MMNSTHNNLISLIEKLGSPRVAVVGDFMIDRYIIGDTNRVSPEAPVPVVHAHQEQDRLGGAGNVAANLVGLGASVICCGTYGDDASGNELLNLLGRLPSSCQSMLCCEGQPTIQKIRVMSRNQQILRVDREEKVSLTSKQYENMAQKLFAEKFDALILSDYGKGVLSTDFTRDLIAKAKEKGIPVLVDPKHKDFSRYAGATLITPNRAEAEAALGEKLPDFDSLRTYGPSLREQSGIDWLLITLGHEGMVLFGPDGFVEHIPTAARQVYDVTGAGDTVISAVAICLASGLKPAVARDIANAAAGIAVSKVGTTMVGRHELLQSLRKNMNSGKVLTESSEELVKICDHFRLEGRKIVFTNGCFDILHAGHVRYLRSARELGDVLILGLNDDESVRRLKGPERPFNILGDRSEVLAGLEFVDLVVAFSEDTPESLIQKISPDVLVKGSDWSEQVVAGAKFVEKKGGEVHFIELLPGRSTTEIADRIRGS